MKLLIATPLFPPDVGGPATDSHMLAAELPKQGIEVVVCSFGKVRHLPSGIRHVAYLFDVLKAAHGIDGIIAMDTFSACIPARIASQLLGKPLIVRVPGDYAWEQSVQRYGARETLEEFQHKQYGFRVELLRSLQRFAVGTAARIVVPSDYFKKIVLAWHVNPDRVKRIYLGLDVNFENIEMPEKPKGKIVLSLGRFVPWKGFAMLVELLPTLPDEWKLVLAGDGPMRAALTRRAHDLVFPIASPSPARFLTQRRLVGCALPMLSC